jgi:N-acetylmuramoyl-L-alanine amidase
MTSWNHCKFACLAAACGLLAACGSSKARRDVLPSQPASVTDSVTIFRSLRAEQDYIPAGKAGRWKARPMRPTYITIHSTQNFSPSADARQHSRALKNGALRGRNSLGYLTWHFSVDDQRAVQHLPLNERGEHADFDGPGNRTSVGIEMCEHRGSNRAATVDRTARLTAILMHAYDIPLRKVVPHYHWPRSKYPRNPHKDCPHFLLDNGKPGPTWRHFLARVNHYHQIAKANDGGLLASAHTRGGPSPAGLQSYFERGSMVRRTYLAGNVLRR